MPMMIPTDKAVMVPVAPGQAVAPGPQHPQAQQAAPAPASEPPPQSPFHAEPAPDLVIMPHTESKNIKNPT